MNLNIISINGDLFKVGGKASEVKNMRIGIAYIYDDVALPYFGEIDDEDDIEIPGIYKLQKDSTKKVPGKVTFELKNNIVKMPKKKDKEAYLIENIKEVSLQDMLADGDITSKKILETSANADVYLPIIQPGDDLAMRVLKHIICKKNIAIKDYDHRFEQPYARSNTKRMIDVGGTLKPSKLEELADIFDFGFVIGIYDKDADIPNPINKDGANKLYVVNYGKGMPLEDYEIVHIEEDN